MGDFLDALGYLALASRLRRLSDDLMGNAARFYKSQGVEFSPKWFGLFKLLTERGVLSVGEAAAQLGLTHPAISQMSKELTSQGLLASKIDARDERRRTLELTRKGRDLAVKIEPIWKAIESASRNLTEEAGFDVIDKLAILEDLLRKRPLVDRIKSAHRTSGVKVVDMESHHKEKFRSLNLAWIERHFKPEPIDERILNNPDAEIIAKGGSVLVAIIEDEVVGVVAIKPASPRPQVPRVRWELMKLAVDHQHLRQGIGELLTREAVVRAKNSGAAAVYLETSRKLDPAVTLYLKLGFLEMTFPAKADRSRTDLVMELTVVP